MLPALELTCDPLTCLVCTSGHVSPAGTRQSMLCGVGPAPPPAAPPDIAYAAAPEQGAGERLNAALSDQITRRHQGDRHCGWLASCCPAIPCCASISDIPAASIPWLHGHCCPGNTRGMVLLSTVRHRATCAADSCESSHNTTSVVPHLPLHCHATARAVPPVFYSRSMTITPFHFPRCHVVLVLRFVAAASQSCWDSVHQQLTPGSDLCMLCGRCRCH
jgi:hypothetical protein